MKESRICQGCGRHCNLDNLHCEIGREYLRTGKLPQHICKNKKHHSKRMDYYQQTSMEDKLIINLREISHMIRNQYEGKLSQKRILMILYEANTLTQRDLTQRLGIQPGSASEILSKLENAGLIVRTMNEQDRRTTDICLTDEGKKQALDAVQQHENRNQEIFSCFSLEERQTLLSLLEKINSDMRSRMTGHHHGFGKHHDHEQ